MRKHLGDGWDLVTADVLMTDSSVSALRKHFENPDATLVRLEGPDGVVVMFPFENWASAYRLVGLKARLSIREKPGPSPTFAWWRASEAIYQLEDDEKKPTQARTAEALGIAVRTLAAKHPGKPWPEIVAAARTLRPWVEKKRRFREWQARTVRQARATATTDGDMRR